jgi:hypothetical protein
MPRKRHAKKTQLKRGGVCYTAAMADASYQQLLREAQAVRSQEPGIEQEETSEHRAAVEVVREKTERLTAEQRFQVLLTLVPFSLVCACCSTDFPDEYADAVKEGWEDIQFDDGDSGWFLGVCPGCVAEEKARSSLVEKPHSEE